MESVFELTSSADSLVVNGILYRHSGKDTDPFELKIDPIHLKDYKNNLIISVTLDSENKIFIMEIYTDGQLYNIHKQKIHDILDYGCLVNLRIY